MTAASLEPLATIGSTGYITYAILLALIIGLFQLLLGALRLGVLVNFLSHPVIIGFSNAAAIIIASSQFSKLFGVTVDKATHHYETVYRIIESAMHYTHWPTFFMGGGALVVMLLLRNIAPRFPSILVVVVISIIVSQWIGFEQNRIVNIDMMRSASAKDKIWELSIQSALLSNLTKGGQQAP
jgi:MFS superfamily sulfate permease-like transporter